LFHDRGRLGTQRLMRNKAGKHDQAVLVLANLRHGVAGDRRLTDGHLTDRGTQLSAEKVADALLSARQEQAAAAR
jgi:hypothetical protein